jgi:hypothetical protein
LQIPSGLTKTKEMRSMEGTTLFYGGLCGLVLTLVAATIVAVVLGLRGRRLRARLEEEYGKKR